MKVRCANCKEFIEKSDAIPRGISNFCSMDCLFAKTNKGKSGRRSVSSTENSKVQSVNRRLVSNELTDEVRDHVLRNDNFRCRLCGGANNLVFHHVIYKSEKKNKLWQDTVSNGITLCNEPCHLGIVHKDKKRFQKLCLGIIWLREVEGDRYTSIYDLEKRLDVG